MPINFTHTLQWRKDDSLIPEIGPELSFSQLQLSDAGQYTCELVMGMVTIVSNRFNISLQGEQSKSSMALHIKFSIKL